LLSARNERSDIKYQMLRSVHEDYVLN